MFDICVHYYVSSISSSASPMKKRMLTQPTNNYIFYSPAGIVTTEDRLIAAKCECCLGSLQNFLMIPILTCNHENKPLA